MKTISLTELRRNPLAALRAVRKGHGIRVTRRDAVIEEIQPAAAFIPVHHAQSPKPSALPLPRTLKRGEAGVVELLRRDRDER